MTSLQNEHYVYKKDNAGNTYVTGEIVFKNKIFQHDPSFTNVKRTLEELPNFPSRKDDIWIIGHPKSGTHWLNEILSFLTGKGATDITGDKDDKFFERLGLTETLQKMASPRFINTHILLKFMPEHILDNAKILVPLRNPKSVIASYFHHRVNVAKNEYESTFSGFLPDYLQGIDDLYGNWFDMVLPYWDCLKRKPNVHFVVYEDLKKNPVEGIKDISDFLGFDHDNTFCEHVAEETSFKSMRKREQDGMHECTFLKGQEGFIRKGSTTDWKTHFTVAQNEMFDALYEQKMKDYPDLKAKIKFN